MRFEFFRHECGVVRYYKYFCYKAGHEKLVPSIGSLKFILGISCAIADGEKDLANDIYVLLPKNVTGSCKYVQ